MGTTTFSGPVISQNGFIGDMTGNVTATTVTATGAITGASTSGVTSSSAVTTYITGANGQVTSTGGSSTTGGLRGVAGRGIVASGGAVSEVYGGYFLGRVQDGGTLGNNAYGAVGYVLIDETNDADLGNGYYTGLLGIYSTPGTNPTVTFGTPGAKAAVLGVIKDNANTIPDAGVMAFMEGDSTGTGVPAAFKAVTVRSTAGGSFEYGLDLNTVGSQPTVSKADIRFNNGQWFVALTTAITTGVTAAPVGCPNGSLGITSNATGLNSLFVNVAGTWTAI